MLDDKGHNEAACRVCHVAHAGSLPVTSAFVLDEPLYINGRVHESSLEFHKSFFVNDSRHAPLLQRNSRKQSKGSRCIALLKRQAAHRHIFQAATPELQ